MTTETTIVDPVVIVSLPPGASDRPASTNDADGGENDAAAAIRFGRSRIRTMAALVAAVAVGVTLVAALAFRATGGQWLGIRTPSMGQAAPVGTLVLTRPATVADLAVGDVITYRPPGEPGVTYTHRVVAIDDGTVTTKGDNNGAADPWRIGDADIVGRVVATWYGVGWLLQGLPWLVAGALVVSVLTARLRPSRRLAGRLVGYPLAYAVVATLLRPYVAMQSITQTGLPGGASVDVVSTGLMPIAVSAEGGRSAHVLLDGQMATVVGHDLDGNGRVDLTAVVHLSPAWLVAVVLVSAVPLAYAVLVGARRPAEGSR